jgi:magnesium-transporting ATPase (P-type)
VTVNTYLTIFGIVASAIVAFSIAYMQRKQMRQLEAHKKDPAHVPLKPPLNPFLRWCLQHAALFLAIPWAAALVVYFRSPPTPLSVADIIRIALSTNMLFLCIILDVFFSIMRILNGIVTLIAPRNS